jgi:MoxR-like ATPase
MLKVVVDYPDFAEERRILDTMAFTKPKMDVERVIELEQILAARAVVDTVHVDEKVRDYIVHVVFATRTPEKYQMADLRPLLQFGASPRATISLTLAAKAWALLQGRSYVTPGDIKAIGTDVLRHRIILTYEAEAQGVTTEAVVKRIFDFVPVP